MSVPLKPYDKFCANQNEDIPYIFWFCKQAKALWDGLFQKISCTPPNITSPNSYCFLESVKTWFGSIMAGQYINLRILIIFCFWKIWRCRNENIFKNLSTLPSFKNAYANAVEYSFLIPASSSPSQEATIQLHWIPP